MVPSHIQRQVRALGPSDLRRATVSLSAHPGGGSYHGHIHEIFIFQALTTRFFVSYTWFMTPPGRYSRLSPPVRPLRVQGSSYQNSSFRVRGRRKKAARAAYFLNGHDGSSAYYLEPHPKFTESERNRFLQHPDVKVLKIGK